MMAGVDGSAKLPRALFVIDDRQRVVQWSDLAAMALGISGEEALGAPCYELIQGRDPFGKAVCWEHCVPFEALRSGHLAARCSLFRLGKAGYRGHLLAEHTALPRTSGGAVVTLARNGASGEVSVRLPAADAESIVHDLAALGTLSTSLSAEHLEQSIELALDYLRQATSAEAAELFLTEPQSGDMLLTAHRGPFRAAFSQISRFHPGEGFPGLVQSRGEAVVTLDLARDPRYLRTRVKEKGVSRYVCVPLIASNAVVGSLHVATRGKDFDTERALRLLTWASRPLSTTLQAGFLQLRESVGPGQAGVLPSSPQQGFDGLLRVVLHQMLLTGGATGGALLVYDRSVRGVVRRVTEGEFEGVVCPEIQSRELHTCPALVGRHGMALQAPRSQWPAACHLVPAGAAMVSCLPLITAEGREVGVVQLGYAERRPSPPTKHFVALLNLAQKAAQLIEQAWANLQGHEQVAARLRELERAVVEPTVGGATGLRTNGASAEPPFLEIRCFGRFEVWRQGKLLTSEAFRRRGALTLLKVLLVNHDRWIARDALVELLWPEVDPQAGANRLHVLLHELRRVIEPARQVRSWLYIWNDGDRYFFNTGATCQLDVQQFRDFVRLGEQRERAGDVAKAMEAYEAAVDLYQGDFLEEEPYAEWSWEEREQYREMCLGVLGKLAAWHREQGATERSVGLYRWALRLDPAREQNHQRLMRVLLDGGRRDEALRQYVVCRELLRRELDAAPLPETEHLYRLALNGSPKS